jgi:RNA polymerase sigma factor (sigma-70 family)
VSSASGGSATRAQSTQHEDGAAGTARSALPLSPTGVPFVCLLRDAQRGKRAALEALAAALYPVIRRYVRSRLADRWDPKTIASDVAQDTALQLVASLARCRARTDGEVVAWAIGITRHALADVNRSADSARAQRRTVSLEAAASHSADAATDTWPDRSVDVLLSTAAVTATGTQRAAGDRHARQAAAEVLPRRPDQPVAPDGTSVSSVPDAFVTEPIDHACGNASLLRVADPLLRLVLEAYEALPADTAAIFWSHLIGNETWEETGLAVGLTAGAAKRRFQRAQSSMRRHVLAALTRLAEPEQRVVRARLAGGAGRVVRQPPAGPADTPATR